MNEKITQLISKLEQQEQLIPAERKSQLHQIAQYFSGKIEKKEAIQPLVVCTHNSRRSHIGQLWFTVVAAHYKITPLLSYSAGTKATELNSRVVEALQSIGFKIKPTGQGEVNPRYQVIWSDDEPSTVLFSKEYTDASIPKKGTVAIMVCSDAEKNCPFIPGSEARFSLPFEDPKEADNSTYEKERYLASVYEIGREITYLLRPLHNNLNR